MTKKNGNKGKAASTALVEAATTPETKKIKPFLSEFAGEIRAFRRNVKGAKIKTEEDAKDVTALGSKIRARYLSVQAQMRIFLKPFQEGERLVRDQFRETLEELEALVQETKDAFLTWEKKDSERKRLAAEKEQKKLDQRDKRRERTAAAAGRPAPEKRQVEAAPLASKVGNGQVRRTWKWRLVDVKKLPKKYQLVVANEAELDQAVKDGVREIPGVEIEEESSVAYR